MGRLDGRVAFITGAGRGLGRSHAVRLASEGADVIAVDLCADITSLGYPMASGDDLLETERLVREQGRRIVARHADVRDSAGLRAAVQAGLDELGRVDIVVANAGISGLGAPEPDPELAFLEAVDINLSGTYRTVEAALPAMIEAGRGGSIVLTSSTAGLKGAIGGTGGTLGYVAGKHGLVGLMRSYATSLAPHCIRVNTIHPTAVNTLMATNDGVVRFAEQNPSIGEAMANLLPVGLLEPSNISDAVLWLVSDEARYVTGVALPVDAGAAAR